MNKGGNRGDGLFSLTKSLDHHQSQRSEALHNTRARKERRGSHLASVRLSPSPWFELMYLNLEKEERRKIKPSSALFCLRDKKVTKVGMDGKFLALRGTLGVARSSEG